MKSTSARYVSAQSVDVFHDISTGTAVLALKQFLGKSISSSSNALRRDDFPQPVSPTRPTVTRFLVVDDREAAIPMLGVSTRVWEKPNLQKMNKNLLARAFQSLNSARSGRSLKGTSIFFMKDWATSIFLFFTVSISNFVTGSYVTKLLAPSKRGSCERELITSNFSKSCGVLDSKL